MDPLNKGYINLKDLQRIADNLGLPISDKALEDILQNCSSNNKITFEDFNRVMTSEY